MARNITIFVVLLVGLLYVLNKNFPDVLTDREIYLHIFQIILVLSIVILGVSTKSIKLNILFRNAIAWLGIALILVSGYSYRYELQAYYEKVLSNIVPSRAVSRDSNTVVFHIGRDGHFRIQAEINGKIVPFLLDTGASRVALTEEDARNIGINVDLLDFSVRTSTANGVALFAPITISQIKVGPIVVKNVRAFVGRQGLNTSLLGMNFLSKLEEYQVSRNRLMMRK